MVLSKRKKAHAIKKTQKHENDTGSAEVQVSILSKRIDDLAAHLKKNKKDKHSRRGLLKLVAKRRSHLKYLQRKNDKAYKAVLKTLGLKK